MTARLAVAVIAVWTGVTTTPSPPGFVVAPVERAAQTVRSIRVEPDGAITTVPPTPGVQRLDDLVRISPVATSQPAAPSAEADPATSVRLLDGGDLRGRLVSPQKARAVTLASGWSSGLVVPFEQIRAVIFGRPDDAMRKLLSERLAVSNATSDALLVQTASGPTALSGALEALADDRWVFRIGQTPRSGTYDRLGAVVLAAGPQPQAGRVAARAMLTDASILTGAITSADESGVRIRLGFGADVMVTWDRVRRIELNSGRVHFLSDQPPVAAESRGFFGQPWSWRADAALDGGPLLLGGETIPKGVAMHSFGRLEFALDRPFKHFAARIGLNPPTADGAAWGDAVFRVLSDDRVVFDSGSVRATQAPRDVMIEIGEPRRLVLEVDYGENLDISDHAVWAEARLLN